MPDHPHGEPVQPGPVTKRATTVLLFAVIGLAFIGFFVGLRQGVPRPDHDDAPMLLTPSQPARLSGAVPAVAYAEFDRRIHGPNSQWRSSLAHLTQEELDLFAAPPEWDEETRAALIQERAARRAFDGAPPVVPHPIDQISAASCMACHGRGLTIGEVRAPMMSHEFLRNCTQCHVEQVSGDLPPIEAPRNLFEAMRGTLGGERAWQGAPPVIPHPTFMRENCMSCHGPGGPDAIRTSHPWQTNCVQCHAPSAVLDQAITARTPAFLRAMLVHDP